MHGIIIEKTVKFSNNTGPRPGYCVGTKLSWTLLDQFELQMQEVAKKRQEDYFAKQQIAAEVDDMIA